MILKIPSSPKNSVILFSGIITIGESTVLVKCERITVSMKEKKSKYQDSTGNFSMCLYFKCLYFRCLCGSGLYKAKCVCCSN